MPIVELYVLEGYDDAEKERLGMALTDAVRLVVPAKPDLVTVMIHEMDQSSYYRGRRMRLPAPARPDPVRLVQDYLSAMENRHLDEARSMLHEVFTMVFPGTRPMADLDELIAWSKPRYRSVSKTYEGFDVMQSSGDETLVYCRGTLSGQYHDGSSFSGIRFVDRFEILDGLISRQEVWNDMAEVRAQA